MNFWRLDQGNEGKPDWGENSGMSGIGRVIKRDNDDNKMDEKLGKMDRSFWGAFAGAFVASIVAAIVVAWIF